MKKIRIAVSACLIGLKYRYDGTSRMNMDIVNTLKDRVDFIPVCPEVECGLSTPRPPMRLETSASGTRIRVIETGEDVTDAMLDWAQNKLDKLERLKIDAYIFKSKSPSCGWETWKNSTARDAVFPVPDKVFSRRSSNAVSRISPLWRKAIFPNCSI